jgi:hypothetical protein
MAALAHPLADDGHRAYFDGRFRGK